MSKVSILLTAKDEASRVLDGVRSSMEKVRGATDIVAAGLGLVGIAGVAGLGQIFKASVDSIDALNDVADATGSSIENISALEDVAIRTGTGMDTVTTALVKFNGVLKEAKPGSAQEQVLKSIGLSAKELRDQDPAEALLTVAKALNQYEDDGNKARITQELFGKSLKDVAPLLKDLADKGVLVAKVTTEQAAEAEKFNKQLFELQKNAQDAGRYLTSDLVQGINKAAQAWRESGLIEAFRTLVTGDDQYKNNVRLVDLTDELLQLENDIVTLKNSGIALDAAQARKKEERLKAVREELKLVQSYQAVLAGDGAPGKPKPSAPDTPDSAAKAQKAIDLTKQQDSALQSLSEQLKVASGEMSEFDRVVERVTVGTWSKFNESTKISALSIAGEIDDAKNLIERQKEVEAVLLRADTAWKNYLENIAKEIDALGDSNITLSQQVEEIGLTTEELNKLRLARMDATIAQQESTLATAEANGLSYEEISVLETKIELLKQQRELTASGQIRKAAADTKAEQDRASKEYSDTLRNDLKGAFSAAFRDSSGEPLKAFGDAIENVIFSRAATALADAAMQSADSFFGKGGGGSGAMDWLSSIFSFDGGGYTGSDSRTGGLDGKGGFMALLHPQETVVDHTKGQQAASAGAISVVQHINIDSRSDQATIVAAMQQAKAEVLSTIQQSRRAGGVYA